MRITLDSALRLACVFNTTPTYWVNLQTNYDIAQAVSEIDVSDIKPLVAAYPRQAGASKR